jgi:hypothetical protein
VTGTLIDLITSSPAAWADKGKGMGYWNSGLLDNDYALDYISTVIDTLHDNTARVAEERPSESAIFRLGAAVGLILQLTPWGRHTAGPRVIPYLQQALERQEKMLPVLPDRARAFLVEAAEDAHRLGQRLARGVDRRIRTALGGGLGYREPVLFEHPAAKALTQEFANECIRGLDEELSNVETREDMEPALGFLAVLLQIEPCKVSLGKINGWHKKAHVVCARAIEEEPSSRRFLKKYLRNLDTAFEAAKHKFRGG